MKSAKAPAIRCLKCGQPSQNGSPHQHTDCISALQAALQREEVLANQLLEASKEARDIIRRRVQWAGIRPDTPLLAQLKAAIAAAEEGSCHQTTTRGSLSAS